MAPKNSPVNRRDRMSVTADDSGDLLLGMGFESVKPDNRGKQPKSKLDELFGKGSSTSSG